MRLIIALKNSRGFCEWLLRLFFLSGFAVAEILWNQKSASTSLFFMNIICKNMLH